jgi:hypothetical protein
MKSNPNVCMEVSDLPLVDGRLVWVVPQEVQLEMEDAEERHKVK